MNLRSTYQRMSTIGRSTSMKEIGQEFITAVIESQMCVSICAYNEISGETYITQYFDCSSFAITHSTIMRFCPRILISIEGGDKSVFFKQLEDELQETRIYFLPHNLVSAGRSQKIAKLAPDCARLQQLQQCYAALVHIVNQTIQISLDNLAISFYKVDDVLIFNKGTPSSLEFVALQKQFKTMTSGGNRLLKANFMQPFAVMEHINARIKLTERIKAIDDQNLHQITFLVQRFNNIDALATQLQKQLKSQPLQQLQLLYQVHQYLRDAQTFSQVLETQNLDQIMNISISQILESDEFKDTVNLLQTNIEVNKLSPQLEEQAIYFILIDTDESLHPHRQILAQCLQNIEDLQQKYQSSISLTIKCKNNKQKNVIASLRNGKVFEINRAEVARSNITEDELRRLFEKEGDQITLMTKTNTKFIILTQQLALINIKIDQSVGVILNLTTQLLNNLYEQLIKNCAWVFSLNQFISQLDVGIAFARHSKSVVDHCYPSFNLDNIAILNGTTPKKQMLSVKFSQVNLVYDTADQVSDQLKMIGQITILAQVGAPLQAAKYESIIVKHLYTHFQAYTVQNLIERQSSFTAEISSLNNILISDQTQSLVLCDSLAISSSHECNVAFNISYIEAISKLKCFALICSNESDIMQVNIAYPMISDKDGIRQTDEQELQVIIYYDQTVIDSEFNFDYKMRILNKLREDFNFPQEFTHIMERNFLDF